MKKFCMLLAAVAAVGVAANADAGFQVTLSAGASSTTIVDGGVGDIDGSVNGILNISSTVGGYLFKTTVATTNSPGGPTIAFVDAGTNEITGTGATSIGIYASANGFTSPASPPALTVMTDATFRWLGSASPGSVADTAVAAFYDATNAMSTSAAGTLIGSDSAAGVTSPSAPVALSDEEVHSFSTVPYALNLDLTAVFYSSGTNAIDLDGGVQATVPEPTTMIMWGSFAALGIPAAIRRRRKAA